MTFPAFCRSKLQCINEAHTSVDKQAGRTILQLQIKQRIANYIMWLHDKQHSSKLPVLHNKNSLPPHTFMEAFEYFCSSPFIQFIDICFINLFFSFCVLVLVHNQWSLIHPKSFFSSFYLVYCY